LVLAISLVWRAIGSGDGFTFRIVWWFEGGGNRYQRKKTLSRGGITIAIAAVYWLKFFSEPPHAAYQCATKEEYDDEAKQTAKPIRSLWFFFVPLRPSLPF
jgi:hypothetical protein